MFRKLERIRIESHIKFDGSVRPRAHDFQVQRFGVNTQHMSHLLDQILQRGRGPMNTKSLSQSIDEGGDLVLNRPWTNDADRRRRDIRVLVEVCGKCDSKAGIVQRVDCSLNFMSATLIKHRVPYSDALFDQVNARNLDLKLLV